MAYTNKSLNPKSLLAIAALVVAIILLKPLIKAFKAGGSIIDIVSDTVSGSTDVLTTALTNIGFIKSKDVVSMEALLSASSDTNYWDGDYQKKMQNKLHLSVSQQRLLSVDGCVSVAEKIRSFFGFWNDDEEGLYNYITTIFSTRCRFSHFCGVFKSKYGQSFSDWLSSGVFLTGLTKTEKAKIHNIILSKPVYI